MNTINIRTLRQNWPETERRLRDEKELIITRRSTPVAKLSLLPANEAKRRERFSSSENEEWLQRTWGRHGLDQAIDRQLEIDRRDRF